MANNQKNIATIVRGVITDAVTSLGCTVWDVEFLREGADYCLRVTIDKEGGVDINDCEKVHRAIDPLLDAADPIEQAYFLQVSSPGLGRQIKNSAQAECVIGMPVEVRLFAPDAAGRKTINGKLTAYGESAITVEINGESEDIEAKSIAKLCLADDE